MEVTLKLLKTKIKKRDDIPKILKILSFKIICEIGVQTGKNLKRLAKAKPELLIGIDPWDLMKDDTENYLKECPKWEKKLREWANKQQFNIRLIKDYSLNAVKLFDDNFFDFVYIDGNHTFNAVTQDIDKWWPKVRKGGILAGHDYTYPKRKMPKIREGGWKKYGVKKAVDKFVSENNLFENLYITKKDSTTSFLILKS